MAIPESQLETWSKQGSVTQSATTYGTIKCAIEDTDAKYENRNFEVFLQGSYGNDSNIYAESDVDVVARYDGAFFHDLSSLSDEDQKAFHAHYSEGAYPYNSFRSHVQAALEAAFPGDAKLGNKAIKIKANGTRRSADVIVAFEFRRYHAFRGGTSKDSFTKGIAFFKSDGKRIVNYPKQHSEKCTAKHKATNGNFKPVVRIFKNMRSKLVDDGLLGAGIAPSYFVEGLLYNVPNSTFQGTYQEMVVNTLSWLHEQSDKSEFVCANEQYYLLRDGFDECWPCSNGGAFITGAIKLWNNW